ncbi:Na+/H+ antiporter NhaC family protein [Vagococcus coleopterorum]|uniref:Na+/H+ antiporter NhaC family protein n=1 Tax=Vagococcus coleopterorum TaxID=2714946 RepID=A0A6G8ALH1_9ENTE|nr:Na+/H+ antiporter NhaC family protein [Vagococcus coleopterorum]QIL45773.1 Na+/H+ antiporter NhaC family protein [Vagococcus coleopterorum]
MKKDLEKGSIVGLLPMATFLILFVAVGIGTGSVMNLPFNLAFFVSVLLSIILFPKMKFDDKLTTFCKSAGNHTVIQMVLIFLLAGIFTGLAKEMGSIEATVNAGLHYLPASLLAPGLFIITSFVSLSIGSCMATIAALTPIGMMLSEQAGLPLGLCIATVLGGAMFGDNLSNISDSTIAAVQTQKANTKEKFMMNIKLVVPGFIITLVALFLLTMNTTDYTGTTDAIEWLKILPYVLIIVLSLTRLNIIASLIIGIISAWCIGFFQGDFNFIDSLGVMSQGMISMEDIAIIAILMSGLSGLMEAFGGVDYLVAKFDKNFKSTKSTEFGILLLSTIVMACITINTVTVLVAGPIANKISERNNLDRNWVASILDMSSAALQAFLPNSAALLVIASAANISVFKVIPYSIYGIVTFITLIIVVLWKPKFLKIKTAN